MRFFNTIYILLLCYIIAALLFWGYSLHKQSNTIYEQQMLHLRTQVDSIGHNGDFLSSSKDLAHRRERRRKQYIGEGSTFLAVIFIGAAIVYSSFRRSIRLSRQQNNFMLSVTHELKSPIAAMKLNLQTLEKYQLDEEKKHLLIDKCIIEANRLNDLCNNMLLASQMEGRQHKAVKEKLNFAQLATEVVNEYTQRYPLRFITNINAQQANLTADKLMLQMAMNNLLENALKYSQAEIKVDVHQKGNSVFFTITDEGVGIADDEKNKVFNKFYRVGNEDTRRTKGTGLGLYLTQKIIKAHKGKITIRDNKPTGAIFELCLPLA